MRNKSTNRAAAVRKKTSPVADAKRAKFKRKKAAASAATTAKKAANKKASCKARKVGKVNYKTGMLYYVGKDGNVMERPLKQNC